MSLSSNTTDSLFLLSVSRISRITVSLFGVWTISRGLNLKKNNNFHKFFGEWVHRAAHTVTLELESSRLTLNLASFCLKFSPSPAN